MEDNDFFDLIYSMWAKTTGAENTYWMYEKHTQGYDEVYEVYAVDEQQEQHFVASFLSDEDVDFITAVHGCFPDLIRKIREAMDEAERLDTERDEQEGRIAELEMELDRSDERVLSYLERIREQDSFIEQLTQENREMERQLDAENEQGTDGWMNESSIMDRWESNGGSESASTDCGLGDR